MDTDDYNIDFNWDNEQFDTDDYFEQPLAARNQRYSNAYGDYRGGYGPPGGFGLGRGGFGPGRGGPRPGRCGPGPNRGGFGSGRGGFGPGRGGFGAGYGGSGPGRGGFGPGYRGVRPGLDGFCPPPPLFPPRPPGPSFMWGTGFGPQGPPKRKMKEPKDYVALRYLARCGVSKENLRNLPKDLLQLIGQQFCGLCGVSFSSFSVSRLHYASKNHLKNQRKFIAQKSDVGSNKHEIPLKARELYCELCDVHITSKSHADLHYAGKPHRAVVEGRKHPKNPKLLQDYMKSRLDQLIRREKRVLKPVEEKPVEVDEPKTVDSELYCDICKTSVTCSDQMTMHLNGKRHLTKEKRYILEVMTGGANKARNGDDKDAEMEDAVEEDAEEEDAEEEDAEGVDAEGAVVEDDEAGDNGQPADASATGIDDWPSGEHEF